VELSLKLRVHVCIVEPNMAIGRWLYRLTFVIPVFYRHSGNNYIHRSSAQEYVLVSKHYITFQRVRPA
jgi:hypothetical protein